MITMMSSQLLISCLSIKFMDLLICLIRQTIHAIKLLQLVKNYIIHYLNFLDMPYEVIFYRKISFCSCNNLNNLIKHIKTTLETLPCYYGISSSVDWLFTRKRSIIISLQSHLNHQHHNKQNIPIQAQNV